MNTIREMWQERRPMVFVAVFLVLETLAAWATGLPLLVALGVGVLMVATAAVLLIVGEWAGM